ncbi:MAG: hypothetical protein OEY09_13910 [Gammaproteobacteria bacterium]|nr:hypothetical protein [Gammaproteobacteria bacterium]
MGDRDPGSNPVDDNLAKTCSASDQPTVDKLLVYSSFDSQGDKIKVWPTPLTEQAIYSLFSENKLLLDQE